MSTWLELKATYERQLVDAYFALAADAANNRALEVHSAIRIERAWRGYATRKYIRYLHNNCVRIQRLWRGYVGRICAQLQLATRRKQARHAFYHQMATEIQRCYRGHMSRRLVIDFYARKRYISSVSHEAQALRQRATLEAEQHRVWNEKRKQQRDAESRDRIASSLHHLLSTRSRAGVYGSTRGDEFKPTIGSIPVEAHIERSFKAAGKHRVHIMGPEVSVTATTTTPTNRVVVAGAADLPSSRYEINNATTVHTSVLSSSSS